MGSSSGRAPADLAVHADARNWVVAGLRHATGELALFFRTAGRIIRHPRQFATEWAQGEFRAFNPLIFLATAAGVTGAFGLVVDRLTDQPGSSSLADLIVGTVEPYANYLLLGLLCHVFLRLLGARRPWYMTLGISLFAGGGPAAAADLLADGVRLVVGRVARDVDSAVVDGVAAGSILLANGVFLVVFALGLSAIHRLRLWRILVSLLAAEIALSAVRVLVFKLVLPEE
jgi:hypothetical protein